MNGDRKVPTTAYDANDDDKEGRNNASGWQFKR